MMNSVDMSTLAGQLRHYDSVRRRINGHPFRPKLLGMAGAPAKCSSAEAAALPCGPIGWTRCGPQADAHVLDYLLQRRLAREPVRCRAIIAATARYYGLAPNDLMSGVRLARIVLPRQVAMYIAKTTTDRSLPEIGRRFGGRDHTTVLHAVWMVDRLRHERADVAAAIEAILAFLDVRGPAQ